jgi:phosphatidylserine decarboxylase
MRIAREGYPLIVAGATLSIASAAAGWKWACGAFGMATLAVSAFFRDPERTIPDGEGIVVSPADGKVVSIADVSRGSRFPETETRVSIFLSPLDVHINRLPVAGEVEDIRHQPGKFVAAYKEIASERNEQNSLSIIDEKGRAFGVVQIAGAVARRIVCWVKPGDRLERGERFGLIMFGSRTDVYLPSGCRLEVQEGQRVRGGETVLGRFV